MNELPTSEQTIGQPAQFQSTVEQPQSMERKNTLIRGALILLYLTIVISGGHRLFKTNSPEESAPQQQIIETSTASPENNVPGKIQTTFLRTGLATLAV